MKKALFFLFMSLFTASIFNNNSITLKAETEEDYISHFEGIKYKQYSDMIMFWSNQEKVNDLYLPGSDSEKYNDESTVRWNGMSYIAKTDNGRLWTTFGTGGYLEPDNLNYSMLKYSDDDGKTWSNESIIIDNITPEKRSYPAILFYDEGRLICYLGVTVFYFDNPDCENPSENLNFPRSMYYSGTPMCHAPLKLRDNYYVTTCENSASPTNIRIIASTNALVWEDIATVYSAGGESKKWNEGQLCKLSDGKLMMLARLDGGSGVEMALSEDEDGYAWSSSKTDLPSPFVGPYSKLCIINTNDGGLLLINHDSTTAREKICCFLSYDDGKTFPYKFVLDDRQGIPASYWGISYPDAIIDKDNNVYITWDQRTPTAEVLNAKLSIDDIKAGKIVTEGSYLYNSIRRCSNYYDIATIEGKFEQYYEVLKGTSKDSIIKNLPTSIHYTDTKGNSNTATGTWKSDDYNANENGLYSIYFAIDNKDEFLLDSYSLLKVRVKVYSNDSNVTNGCKSNASQLSIISLLIVGMALIIMKRKAN